MDKNRIYTVKEVARLLDFSTNTIYKYLDEGKIKSTRLGEEGRFRIPQKEVAKLLGVKRIKPQIDTDLKPEEGDNLEAKRELYKESRNEVSEFPEEIQANPNLKSKAKVAGFMATFFIAYVLLAAFSLRNIHVSAARIPQLRPATSVLSETQSSEPTPTPEELPETTPEVTPETTPKTTSVKTDDKFSLVNVRSQPSTDSEKIGRALGGDTFEFVSENKYWYEVRLKNGSTGFISKEYIVKEESKE